MKVFIVEDDPFYAKMLDYQISQNPDNQTKLFLTAGDVLSFKEEYPDVITLDYSLPDMEGLELLKKVKQVFPNVPIIVVSSQQEIETVLDLLKEGIYDYVIKNDDVKDRIWMILKNINKTKSLKDEIQVLKEEVASVFDFSKNIIGESTAIKNVFNVIRKAVKTNINITVSGETGTGKEVVAKCIHFNSSKSNKKFVAVNMAAIPENLIESELFGYEKGAFTGAVTRRIGKFEEANGGTIFLDEIGELDINMQAKLLRVLQENEVTPIGSNKSIKLDVRIISATHQNLLKSVEEGCFREDLYYRLIGLPIHLPPLRDRENDVLLIANFFLNEFAKRNKLGNIVFSMEAKTKLLDYHFPGNVRELKSIVELAAVMADELTIKENDININSVSNSKVLTYNEKTLKEFNLDIIKHYLRKYNDNVMKVSEILDISKSKVYQLIKDGELI